MKFTGRRVAVAVVALAASAGFLAVSSVAAVASGAPYTDPNANGSIGLCDQTGQPLTKGDLETRPFAWKAVGETAGPAPYNQTGATAQLYAFQPRKGVDPGDWSGEQLSGASRFSNLAHPTAALTGLDESLAVFAGDFPPQWDGYVQLRLYLNAPDAGEYTTTYNATNIVIKGDKWSVVGGTAVPCGGSPAVSDKQVLATTSAAAASLTTQTVEGAGGSPPPVKGGKKASSGSSKSAGATADPGAAQPGASGGVVPAPSGSPAVAGISPNTEGDTAASGSSGRGSSSDTLLWILVGVGVLGAGFVGVQWLRSRT
jgi:hypothetical protein